MLADLNLQQHSAYLPQTESKSLSIFSERRVPTLLALQVKHKRSNLSHSEETGMSSSQKKQNPTLLIILLRISNL